LLRRLASGEEGFGLVELMIAMTVMAIGIAAIVTGFSSGILAVSRASQASNAGTLADKQMEAYRAIPYYQIMVTSTSDTTYANDPSIASPLYPLTTSLTPAYATNVYDGAYCTGTTSSAATTVGATSITVPSAATSPATSSQIIVGTPISVGTGTLGETSTVTNIAVAGSTSTLSLSPALTIAHASSSVVTPMTCVPVQSNIAGPDGRQYRVDSFIAWYCPAGTLTTSSPYSQTGPACLTSGTSVAVPVKQVTVVVRNATTTSKTYIRETSTFDPAT
jgi:prepilin-type N-terminal cleavage/methylation domain-containing protein